MRAPYLRLGVNIDHVATIRNARGGPYPDPMRAAMLAAQAGADGITAHLREDRRHISDADLSRLSREIELPLNMECAATPEMLEIALRHRPHAVCLVPEKREEKTTEGGLDVAGQHNHLKHYTARLRDSGIRVSLFINPDERQIIAARDLQADIVELHAGGYCDAVQEGKLKRAEAELAAHQKAAQSAAALGLEVHAGHGISFDTVGVFAAMPQVVELNIGHFLIGEAIFIGLHEAVTRMRRLMDEARR
ncbi:MAG TPA: pyridoxine 5'-phosphate synthase [Alphaproteobacteria bacterium]|nr:pyridoxine 5'-phosphate synthase [Alphaproteobacteria bacterium]